MSVEQSSKPFSAALLPAELEILIERVVERTLGRLATIAQHPFISSKECARVIGVTPEHLSAMRARGDGPPWSGRGKWIRYNRGDVLAWLASLPTQTRATAYQPQSPLRI
jgi:hypothetical protein